MFKRLIIWGTILGILFLSILLITNQVNAYGNIGNQDYNTGNSYQISRYVFGNGDQYIVGNLYRVYSNCSVYSMGACLKYVDVQKYAQCVIYDKNGNLLGSSNQQLVSSTSFTWYTFTFSPAIDLLYNNQYYLCVWGDSATTGFELNIAVSYLACETATIHYWYDAYNNYPNAPSSLTFTSASSGFRLAIYGNALQNDSSITLYENEINVTGTHEYNKVGNDFNIWANYTGNTTAITLINNTVNCTGTYEYLLNATGYYVYANFTGNATGGGNCSGIVWVNYTDSNLTFNVSVNKSDDSNTSTYSINSDNWLLINGLSLNANELGLFIVFLLFSIAVFSENIGIWKPLLLMFDTPISLITGVTYLGYSAFSIQWAVGLILILFSLALSIASLFAFIDYENDRRKSKI